MHTSHLSHPDAPGPQARQEAELAAASAKAEAAAKAAAAKAAEAAHQRAKEQEAMRVKAEREAAELQAAMEAEREAREKVQHHRHILALPPLFAHTYTNTVLSPSLTYWGRPSAMLNKRELRLRLNESQPPGKQQSAKQPKPSASQLRLLLHWQHPRLRLPPRSSTPRHKRMVSGGGA